MGLFDGQKETKEEKQKRKEQEMLQKYRLDTLTDPKDIASVRLIASELLGMGLMETGVKMSFGKAEDQLKISYLRAIMEQNFIMIRQLDKISNLLSNN